MFESSKSHNFVGMKRETYEKQKAFAGEKKASMSRRLVGHDYTERMMYMVTIVVEGRRPLLGTAVGRADAPADSAEAPRVQLTELGRRVSEEWMATSQHHPEITVVALQIMPDHLHGILFVKGKMEKPLGMALRGFKQKCNQHYRELFPAVQSVALPTQQTPLSPQQPPLSPHPEDRHHGLLFARGYNDKLLLRDGQLQRWLDYLRDNPRRLLMKRQHPEWLRPFFGLQIGQHTYSGIGNRLLLSAPRRRAVRVSRRLTEAEIAAVTAQYLDEARQGAVLVSPAISPGEKHVMRAAFDAGLPAIVIMENGFAPLSKPHGEQFYACAQGRLLMLSPWEHHNERRPLTAAQCTQMNLMALEICG